MKVYHGSNKIIDTPTYGLGKSNNDYGKGFYMTEDFEIASLWASKYENDGYVNTYELNLEGLKILNLADSDEEDQNESIVWREKDGGAAIYYPETGSAISYFFYTNENGNLILDMVMTNGEVTLSYNEEYGTWIKTA